MRLKGVGGAERCSLCYLKNKFCQTLNELVSDEVGVVGIAAVFMD